MYARISVSYVTVSPLVKDVSLSLSVSLFLSVSLAVYRHTFIYIYILYVDIGQGGIFRIAVDT